MDRIYDKFYLSLISHGFKSVISCEVECTLCKLHEANKAEKLKSRLIENDWVLHRYIHIMPSILIRVRKSITCENKLQAHYWLSPHGGQARY